MSIEKTLEQESALGRKLTVHIDADTMQQARASRLRDIGGRARLPGFRKGKIPAHILEREYGARASRETTEHIVQQSLSDAIREEQLHLVETPQVKIIESRQQGGLSYCASFDVFPQVELKPESELNVLQPYCEITEQDIETALNNLRQRYPDEILVEREAHMGDAVYCDMTFTTADGTQNGPRQQRIVLDDKVEKPVLDFILGAKAGDSGEVTVDGVSEDTRQMPLHISIARVCQCSPSELDTKFFRRMGVSDLDTLRLEISNTMKNEAIHLQTRMLWQRVCAALREQHKDMDLPPKLVAQETERLQQSGMDEDQAKRAAADAIREHLLIELYVGENDLEPSPREVRHLVERAASGHKNPKAYVDWHYADSSRLHNYRWAALQHRVLTHITQKADFTRQNISFAELSKQAS